MNDEFTLRFKLRKKEWFRCMICSDFIFNGKILRYSLPILLLVFIAGFQFFRYKNIGNAVMLLGISFFYIGAILVSFFITASKQFREYHTEEETWQLNNCGVSGKIFGEETFTAWQDIFKCEITKNCIYLYVNALLPVYLPRSSFSTEAFDFMIKKIGEESNYAARF